jgi:hypothetical protein
MIPHDTITALPAHTIEANGQAEAQAPTEHALSLAEFAGTDTARENAATWDFSEFRKNRALHSSIEADPHYQPRTEDLAEIEGQEGQPGELGAKRWPRLRAVQNGVTRVSEWLPASEEREPIDFFVVSAGRHLGPHEQKAFADDVVTAMAGYEATREALRVALEQKATAEKLLDEISGQYPDGDEWAADQYQHGSRLCAAVMEWRAIRVKGGE